MKIGFIIPPRAESCPLPLQALYVVSVLKENHHEVVMIDLSHSGATIDKKLFRGINLFWMASDHNFTRTLQIKGFLPSYAKTIISGADPTIMPEYIAKYGWDYVLVGEPELAANGVVSGYFQPGILTCQVPEDLDALPYPSRNSVSIKNYYPSFDGDSWMEIMASRGSVKSPFNVINTRPRQRSAQNVIAEMHELNEVYGIKRFILTNYTFPAKGDNLRTFCNLMKKNDYEYTIEGKLSDMEEVAAGLANSGCREILSYPSDVKTDRKVFTNLGIRVNMA